MAQDNGCVRRWFRVMRTEEHLIDADLVFHLQHYVTGQFAIVRIGRGVTLYDSDLPVDLVALRSHVFDIHTFYEMRDRNRARWRSNAAMMDVIS